jgi:uncharacterized protein (TIGR03435 family)
MKRAGLITAAVVATALTLHPAAQPLQFEVASVKQRPSDGDRRVSMVAQPGGRFVAVNVPLYFLIRTAYQIQNDQIAGGPGWIRTDRFDIEARADAPGLPGPELLERLKSLLAERFSMVAHNEQRELPVFALERVAKDGGLGPGLHVTACPDVAADLVQPTPCVTIQNPAGALTMRGMPFNQIAPYLSAYVGRVVVDKTGLTERYDFDLRWTPDVAPQGRSATAQPPAIEPSGVSIFTALQEQLGLRLTATRAMVDVLVIDRLEHPTPN